MKKKTSILTASLFSLAMLPYASQAWSLPGTVTQAPDLEPAQPQVVHANEENQIVNLNCGNGDIDKYEQCDDGNTDSGDGCSKNCFVEESEAIVEDEKQPEAPVAEATTGGCTLSAISGSTPFNASNWLWILGVLPAVRKRKKRLS